MCLIKRSIGPKSRICIISCSKWLELIAKVKYLWRNLSCCYFPFLTNQETFCEMTDSALPVVLMCLTCLPLHMCCWFCSLQCQFVCSVLILREDSWKLSPFWIAVSFFLSLFSVSWPAGDFCFFLLLELFFGYFRSLDLLDCSYQDEVKRTLLRGKTIIFNFFKQCVLTS